VVRSGIATSVIGVGALLVGLFALPSVMGDA